MDKPNEVEEARIKLLEYIEQNNVKQSQIFKAIGISSTTLSLFINGSYTGDNEEVTNKVKQFLSMQNIKQSLSKAPDFYPELENTEEILQMVRMIHALNEILLVYGPAGCGKTAALKRYTATNSNVVYVQADATAATPRTILSLILETMGEKAKTSTAAMMIKLIDLLKDTNQLIILDEAQHLTSKSFDTLRALNDKAGVGIVYSGNPSIIKRMYGRKEEEFDQVYSRIAYQCDLGNYHSKKDIENIFKEFNLSKECINYLFKVSHKKGGLRRMIKQYKLANNLAIALQQELAPLHLEQAAKRMGNTTMLDN